LSTPNSSPSPPPQGAGGAHESNPWIPAAPPAGPSLLLRQRRGLRRLSLAGGCALLLVSLLGQLMVPLGKLARFVVTEERPERALLWYCFVSLLGQVILMGGALLGLRLLRPVDHNRALNFERPFHGVRKHDTLLMAAVIFVGIALCYDAGLAWDQALALLEKVGIALQSPPGVPPQNLPGFVLELVAVAIAPAFIEETFLRGMILQPLRRFGSGFAVAASALLFALLHQNAAQAPFAFLAGLVLGWAAVYSGSLWLPIMIHFWNNAISVMFSAIRSQSGEAAARLLYNWYGLAVCALGLVGLVILLALRRHARASAPPKPAVLISAPGRAVRYLLGSVPMALVVAYFCMRIYLDIRH